MYKGQKCQGSLKPITFTILYNIFTGLRQHMKAMKHLQHIESDHVLFPSAVCQPASLAVSHGSNDGENSQPGS